MNYEEFRQKVNQLPVIDTGFLKLKGIYTQSLKVQLQRWRKKGKIIKLRKNLYILRTEDRKINPSRLFISNELYKPSYVGVDYALSFYGLIPERVTDITNVTTKKTANFVNALGKFVYQHVKSTCFMGFIAQKDDAGLQYLISTPEKAVVDFIYLNLSRFGHDFKSVLTESFRFQNLENLNKKNLIKYTQLFGVKKLESIIKALIELRGEQK